jgi:thiamine-phosphate pyrophosphorylase
VSLPSKLPRAPLLCYVTDLRAIAARESAIPGVALEPTLARDALLAKIAAAAAAGLDWIQIREKHLTARECSALVREALERVESQRVAGERARVLVNDSLDVALAAQAGGVHLAEKSLPPQEAKRLVRERGRGENFLVGVSCHSLEAAKAAELGGADYLFFGPVFATPLKAAYGAPQGLDRLAEVCHAVSIPVLAIGGITLENCAACLSAEASGIAAIRLFQDAADLPELVQSLRNVAR